MAGLVGAVDTTAYETLKDPDGAAVDRAHLAKLVVPYKALTTEQSGRMTKEE